MFAADRKALFAKFCLDIWFHLLKQIFLEGQKSIFLVHCPAHLHYFWQFFLVFVTNYPSSWHYWWILYLVILWLNNLVQCDKPKRLIYFPIGHYQTMYPLSLTPTHPNSSPPSQNNVSPTPTHIHLPPTTQNNIHPPIPTQYNPHLLKIIPH